MHATNTGHRGPDEQVGTTDPIVVGRREIAVVTVTTAEGETHGALLTAGASLRQAHDGSLVIDVDEASGLHRLPIDAVRCGISALPASDCNLATRYAGRLDAMSPALAGGDGAPVVADALRSAEGRVVRARRTRTGVRLVVRVESSAKTPRDPLLFFFPLASRTAAEHAGAVAVA